MGGFDVQTRIWRELLFHAVSKSRVTARDTCQSLGTEYPCAVKVKPLALALLFLLSAAAFQLAAEQRDADRKLFDEIRAKAEKGDAQSQFESFLLSFLESVPEVSA